MRLKNKTVFITGASRGIGKAIALCFAREGANIAIAAKTATAHEKLPGTIYTAATEVEQMGGKALPLIVDVRDEDQTRSAIEQTAKHFGGIDILVNNASAIFLAGTLSTPMKRFDLMHQVNTRATYLCSSIALPFLLKAENPHILTLSPPLNLNPRWFKNHTAYTISKYGMSMCVLGLAEEFRSKGVAVNALWPKTTIATAAVKNMVGGEAIFNKSRLPEIMADAALEIVTQNSRELTGQFLIDEEVLKLSGMTDFKPYAVSQEELMPDFFLD